MHFINGHGHAMAEKTRKDGEKAEATCPEEETMYEAFAKKMEAEILKIYLKMKPLLDVQKRGWTLSREQTARLDALEEEMCQAGDHYEAAKKGYFYRSGIEPEKRATTRAIVV